MRRAVLAQLNQQLDRIVDPTSRSVAEHPGRQPRVHEFTEDLGQRSLPHPVGNCGHVQSALAARRLGDLHRRRRARLPRPDHEPIPKAPDVVREAGLVLLQRRGQVTLGKGVVTYRFPRPVEVALGRHHVHDAARRHDAGGAISHWVAQPIEDTGGRWSESAAHPLERTRHHVGAIRGGLVAATSAAIHPPSVRPSDEVTCGQPRRDCSTAMDDRQTRTGREVTNDGHAVHLVP